MNHTPGQSLREAVQGSILAFSFLTASPAVHAVNPPLPMGEYAHTSWTTREGYPLSAVFAMAEAPDGYLWMASQLGVARFDGEKFVIWRPTAGKEFPVYAYSMLVARDGTLWLGTFDGLARWDGKKLTELPGMEHGFITSMIQDRDGTIWAGVVGAKRGALCEVRDQHAQCHEQDGAFGKFVWSLAQDDSGTLWVGADSGLWRWKPGAPERFELPDRVSDLLNTRDGLVVGLRGAGLLHFVDGKLEPLVIRRAGNAAGRVPDAVIKSNKLLTDSAGNLWIGADGTGLHLVQDGAAQSFNVATGLSGDIACSLYEDREGNIWFSSENGVDRFRKLSVATRWVERGAASEITKSVMAARDGSVWVAAGEGVSRWMNGDARYYRNEKGLPGTGGQALFEDLRGRIWVSTYNGLAYFEGDRFVAVDGQPGNDVVGITGDSAGNLWLAGPGSLVRFKDDKPAEEILWVTFGVDHRARVLADRGGVWLGFWTEGSVLFVKDGKVHERYTTANGLASGHVNHLRLDADAALWVAAEGGLSRIKDGRVDTLAPEDGLPCLKIYWSIEDDHRNLWTNTSCGLVRITRADLDAWLANPSHIIDTQRWGEADGVPVRPDTTGYSPPVTKTADGKLWFVNGQGIQIVDPDHLAINPIAPPVYIEQIVADRKPYRVTSDTRLPALTRDVTIEFTAVSLTDAGSAQFRYRLEGHDRGWQDAGGRRQAFYTKLGPGTFRFSVKASNNNGVWNEKGAQLLFSIAPAYYQTGWFRVTCAVLVGTLIWGGFMLHAQRVRREEKRLWNVIEGLPTLAFSVFPDGALDLVNQRWLDYFGVVPGAQNLSAWRSSLHPDDAGKHLDRWYAALASGEPFENEARHRSAAGEYRWFLVRAVPMRDSNGKIVRWSGTLTDIDDRKRTEDERERLRRLQAHLSHTNRLSMLGELTASIAHEINQPIGATIASAGAGLRWLDHEQPALQQARDAFMRIKDDGKRAADIISGLRAFYIKEGSPQRESLDLNEVIREMCVLLRSEAERHSVSMRTELAAGLPRVRATRVQLQQVLMNLMVNGIEAMKEKGGHLVISTEAASGGIKVCVSDTGVGIPAERVDQIFDAFVTTKTSGTGMGLAISRTIIESHDGKIWVETQPGAGATFCFSLPAES